MTQVPALFLPFGVIKKVTTERIPLPVEQKKNNKICALLKGKKNGYKKNHKS